MGHSKFVPNIATVHTPYAVVNHVRIHFNRVAWIPANVHSIRQIVHGMWLSEFSESYVETILYIYLLRNAGISMRYGCRRSSFALECKIANDPTYDVLSLLSRYIARSISRGRRWITEILMPGAWRKLLWFNIYRLLSRAVPRPLVFRHSSRREAILSIIYWL